MMDPIAITLTERAHLDRNEEPVRFGVPLQRTRLRDTSELQLEGQNGTRIPADFRPLSYWPDGSVRWVCVEALVSLTAGAITTLQLKQLPQDRPHAEGLRVSGDERLLTVETRVSTLQVNRSSLAWWLTNGEDGQHQHTSVILEDKADLSCTAQVEEWRVVHHGTLSAVLEATGWWHDSTGAPLARFRCELTMYTTGQLAVETCIHNPRRASHPGGLWDLGDPGSIHFGALGIRVDQPNTGVAQLALTEKEQSKTFNIAAPLVLLQDSSGGDQWQSRNHIGASGKVLPRFRGYRLTMGDQELDAGDRASPLIEVSTGTGGKVSASLPHFWQNFPSALQVDADGLTAWLFPQDKAEPYELQGGERKTQKAMVAYGQPLDSLRWTHAPLLPVIPAKHFEETNAFPWFRADAPNTPLDDLIREGLDGPANFFRKREVIDEYGWRNFGDLFADHETLYQEEGEAPYISHYNNQYDAIYGFARQYARTGDPRWFELMDDLARHVADIDIYHTDEDRSEYNHGLFWHTDHYLDAHTGTHRTFTKHNDTSSTPGQLGGGPAAEHCYSTGLLYHYLLTGCQASRDAVLDLANWMKVLHHGQGGLLEQILALKKKELPKLREKLRGGQPFPHRFPFTRGTGNYINTILDAYLLEPCSGWLELAGQVIRQTIHPADDIEQRQLLIKETGWSYLVLLSSIVRYLGVKGEAGEQDDDWSLARDSFLHYARWMRETERPFLHNPAELEFDNHTWVAQDIRKVMIMYQAAVIFPQEEDSYRAKAAEWFEHIYDILLTSRELHFSRIQVLLLQNYGPHQIQSGDVDQTKPMPVPDGNYEPPALSWGTLLIWIAKRLARGVIGFNLHKEKAWLDTRLDRQ